MGVPKARAAGARSLRDGVVVRRATMEDLPALSELFRQYRAFYRVVSEPAACHLFLRDRLQRRDSLLLVSCDDGDRLTGFAQLYPIQSSLRGEAGFILNDLFVAPAARRAGIGRALLRAAHHQAREAGARFVELATERTNYAAKLLYESEGYQRDTAFEHHVKALSAD